MRDPLARAATLVLLDRDGNAIGLEPVFRRDIDLHLRRMTSVPAVQTPLAQQKTILTSPRAAHNS
jgi:hypothetical protein